MAEIPKRRGLRFSLRAMFVLVTAMALWLGWNAYVVRERRAMLEYLGDRSVVPLDDSASVRDLRGLIDEVISAARQADRITTDCKYFPATESASLSWLRRQLGDRPYLVIGTYQTKDVPRIRKWFPEAVCVVNTNRPQIGHLEGSNR